MQFRKKPVVIEAFQLPAPSSTAYHYFPPWFIEAVCARRVEMVRGGVNIPTLEGVMRGDVGDWIILGIKGEMYPCKPDIFEATYEAVSPTKD